MCIGFGVIRNLLKVVFIFCVFVSLLSGKVVLFGRVIYILNVVGLLVLFRKLVVNIVVVLFFSLVRFVL